MIMQTERPEATASRPERSLGDLFRGLSSDTAALMRQEMALARVELTGSLRRTARRAAGMAVAAALIAVGGLVLTAALVVLLGALLGEYWLAALLVALLYLAAGAVGARSAMHGLRQVELSPHATLDSLESTGRWARAEAAELRASLTRRDGHGRDATTLPPVADTRSPVAPPAGRPEPRRERKPAQRPEPRQAGVMGLLKRTVREVGDDDISGQAAKVAYYAFMAIPPGLMAAFAIAGLFGSAEFASMLLAEARLALPADVVEGILQPFVTEVVMQEAPGPLSIGLLLALWGASGVFVGLMDTLNVAYDVEESRSFVRKRATALGVMLVGSLLFLLGAVALLAGPELASLLGLGGVGEMVWNVVRWPLTFSLIVAAFWLGYYFLPDKDQRGCRKTLLKASAIAAALWLIATAAFRIYIANFSSYSATYGFLGAFIILLLWLYVTGLVVLAGGELASEMEEGF